MTQASTITLAQVKAFLQVTHDLDDAKLAQLLESAQQECLRYTGRSELPTLPYNLPPIEPPEGYAEDVPSVDDPVAPDVAVGVFLMVQSDYEGDPAKWLDYREGAERKWLPYRIGLVV